MDSDAAKSGWDVVLLGIPLIALLVFGFFRLDERYTSRKVERAMPPPDARPNAKHRRMMRSDPDGRPWDGE